MSANAQQALTEASEIDPANIVMVYQANNGQLAIKFNSDMPMQTLMVMSRLLEKHIDMTLFPPPKPSPIARLTV